MTQKLPLYLDHQASTPLAPEVMQKMRVVDDLPGNSSSLTHIYGHEAKKHIREATAHIRGLINAPEGDIIFTSGATEANNLALLGKAFSADAKPLNILTTSIEHSSVSAPLQHLADRGSRVSLIPVNESGLVDLAEAKTLIIPGVDLVAVQAANNEIGTRQPLAQIGALCARVGAHFHVDAAQGIIGQTFDAPEIQADTASLSGHKIYGPQGIGALYMKSGIGLAPLQFGGNQQKAIRPGTLPTSLIAGLGVAAALALKNRTADRDHLSHISDLLVSELSSALGQNFHLNGPTTNRLPGNLSLAFKNVDAEDLMLSCPELAFSTGSACQSENMTSSPVLKALGLSSNEASSTIRIGLGRFVTANEIRTAANILISAYLDLVN
jgi:cysteine desulfurase